MTRKSPVYAALLALAVLFALPATGSASPLLTKKFGEAVKVKETLNGHFGEAVFKTTTGHSLCATWVEGPLLENTGTKVAIEAQSYTALGNLGPLKNTCLTTWVGPDKEWMNAKITTDGTIPWCLEAAAARPHEMWFAGGKCGVNGNPIRLVFELYEQTGLHQLVATCTYEEEEQGKGAFTTKQIPAWIEYLKWEFTRKAGNPTWCPAKGNYEFVMLVSNAAVESMGFE
jgi:hypothetical protein